LKLKDRRKGSRNKQDSSIVVVDVDVVEVDEKNASAAAIGGKKKNPAVAGGNEKSKQTFSLGPLFKRGSKASPVFDDDSGDIEINTPDDDKHIPIVESESDSESELIWEYHQASGGDINDLIWASSTLANAGDTPGGKTASADTTRRLIFSPSTKDFATRKVHGKSMIMRPYHSARRGTFVNCYIKTTKRDDYFALTMMIDDPIVYFICLCFR
jgi:hypothetical protein